MSEVLVLIPARYQSSRFPGKPLAPIKNKTMIQRVYENCRETGFDAYVVTDDDKIANHCKEMNINYLRVDDDVASGTERIALALQRNFEGKYKLVVNVQGDEPLLPPDVIKSLVDFHLNSSFDMATLVRERESGDIDYKNPNIVKAKFIKEQSKCETFSRTGFGEEKLWYQHLGIYSYKPEVLVSYLNNPVSEDEKRERLEQLRALSLGYEIGAQITEYESIGVDAPEDIKKIEEVLSEQS